MGSLGAPELIIIILAVMLLVGYKKLPDASRSIGRSLRIFKGEMKGLREDDGGSEAAPATTVREPLAVTAAASSVPVDEAERLVEEARAAEARAAELRARADTARAAQAVPPAEGPR